MQQITINDPSGIESKYFPELQRKFTTKNSHLWSSILLLHQIIHYIFKGIYSKNRREWLWSSMIKSKIKNCIMKLTGQLQRYLHYHQERYKYEFLTGEATQKAIFFLLLGRHWKNKQKLLRNKEKNTEKHLNSKEKKNYLRLMIILKKIMMTILFMTVMQVERGGALL